MHSAKMWYPLRKGWRISLAFKIDRGDSETKIYFICSYLILSGSAVCVEDDAAKMQLTYLTGTGTLQD